MRRRFALALAAAAALCLCLPSAGWAMKTLNSDVGDADPCAATGDNGGVLIKRNTTNAQPPNPQVSVLLQCSPKMELNALETMLANDIVARYAGGIHRGEPFFRGNMSYADAPDDDRWLNTVGFPYIHGNIAEALRLQEFQGAQAIKDALIAAGVAAGSSLAISVIICAAGGIPTLGIACAAVPAAIGAAVVEAVTAAVGAVIKAFVTAQINRISAMGDADWFVWSDTKTIWNSFGDITDTWINPSLTNLNPNFFRKWHVRIGVQFSNVPVGQGPEYFSVKSATAPPGAKTSAAAAPDGRVEGRDLGEQIRTLNFNAAAHGISPAGGKRVRTGDAGPNVLRGGPGDDVLRALGDDDRASGGAGGDLLDGGPGNDTLSGDAGRDQLYGGRGNDVIRGGSGHDILLGGRGADLLDGGSGPDWIVDAHGPTTARTGSAGGRGEDFVNVRDGVGDDTVTCENRGSEVVVDRGDRVRGRCGRVVRTGLILRLPG